MEQRRPPLPHSWDDTHRESEFACASWDAFYIFMHFPGDKLLYREKELEKKDREKRQLNREREIYVCICALGFRHLCWKCCLCSSLAGPWGPGGQKSRWREGRVASLDRYRKAQWALSRFCSPSHPHFSCCLDKSTIPTAKTNKQCQKSSC